MTPDPIVARAMEAANRRLAEMCIPAGSYATVLLSDSGDFFTARIRHALHRLDRDDWPEVEVFRPSLPLGKVFSRPPFPAFAMTGEEFDRAYVLDDDGESLLEVRVGCVGYALEPVEGR
jgi:hypothetical protein